MLIVNYKVLPNNPSKDHELYTYAKEYQEGVANLKAKFPTGYIQLKRNGYPKMNISPDPNMPSLPEIPPPIFIKLTKTDSNGTVWGYCKGRAKIEANGLASVPEEDNSEILDGEVLNIDLNGKPDYAFFIMNKTGLLRTEFTVYDPQGDKLKDLRDKNAKLKVQSSIRDMTDEKLRMICQAWGITNAGTKDPLLLQEEIENLVFVTEDKKKKDPTDLMLRGVNEFLAEIKNDEVSRPKAIIQYGIDEKRITFNPAQSKYYFDEAEICYVPLNRHSTRQEFLAQVFRDPDNSEKWVSVLKALVTVDYINAMDKYGVRWLCIQLGIPVNAKEEDLRATLLEQFQTV